MRPIFHLLVGLVVGAAATSAIHHLQSPATLSGPAPDIAPSASSSSLPAPRSSLVLPPTRLAGPDADEALAAYLALTPLSPDSPETLIAERAVRLRTLLTLLPPGQVAQLLDATTERGGEPEARLRRITFTAWTELDAPSAAHWAAALGTDSAISADSRSRLVSEAALAWAREDFTAAYAWAGSLASPDLARAISADLLADLAITNPAQALALARAGDLDLFSASSSRIFYAWLDQDPAQAFAALGSEIFSEQSPLRRHLPLALSRWAAHDLDAAFAWFDARGFGSTHKESMFVISLVGNLAALEPPPNFNRLAHFLAARAERGLGRKELGYLLRDWMPVDPTAALAWLDQLPDPALRVEVLKTAIYAAGANPEQAVELTRYLPAGAAREKELSNILSHWSESDPDAALAWLKSSAGASLGASPAAHSALVVALAQTDPEAALAHWRTLDSEAIRLASSPALARAWSRIAPDEATAWLFAQIPEGPHPDDRAAFASLSPEANIAASQRGEKNFQQLIAFKETSATWGAQNPAAYAAWAQSLPSATQRRAALYALSWPESSSTKADVPVPESRLALLSTLRDETTRDSMMRTYLAKWLATDPASARTWVTVHAAHKLLPATQPSFTDQLRSLTAP